MPHSIVVVTPGGHTILDRLLQSLIPEKIVLFLNNEIINTTYIWINNWSFIHILSGMLWFKLYKGTWQKWFWISLAFEVTEFILGGYTGSPLYVEELKDIVWDMVFNMAGFFIMKKYWS